MFTRLSKASFAVAAALFFSTSLFGQRPDTLWTKIYASPGPDVAYSVIETSDAYYLTAGYTGFGAGGQDGWLLKLNNSGDTLWSKPWGGTGYDGLHAVIEASDGGYLLVGFTESFGAGGKDVYLIKTDSDGNQVWTKTYGGSLQDVGYAGCVTSGGYVICGYIDGPFDWTKGDLWILKIDESGDTLWTRRYGGVGEDYCISVRSLSSGYIMSGVNSASGGKDAWLVSIDDAGDTLWTSSFGDAGEDVAYGVNLSHDGGYVITGYVDGTGAWTPGNLWIIKTDSDGNEEWRKTYSAGPENFGFEIHPTTDGGYVIGGLKGTNSGDLWILKIDDLGDTIWTGAWGSVYRENALSLYPTSDGGYLAAGMTMPGAAPDLYLVKTRPVLELTSPNGGENLQAGGFYTIRWHVENTPQPPHSFRLLYSSDGGASYDNTIASDISPEDTSYEWTVPTEQSESCRIKIQLHDGFFDVIAEDESEANFIIGPGVEESDTDGLLPWIEVNGNTISYYLPASGIARIEVYDACGTRVAVLVHGYRDAGYYTLRWQSGTCGVYFFRFSAPGVRQAFKITVVE